MSKTKIEWTDATWNPVTGCTPVSEGCENCYAKRRAETRFRGRFGYPADEPFRVTVRPDRLAKPPRGRPKRVFVCSMGDLFHEDVPFTFQTQVWYAMRAAEQHIFQVLTKRPENLVAFYKRTVSYPFWPLPNIWLGTTIENARNQWRASRLAMVPAAVRFVSVEPMLGPVDLSEWMNPYGCGSRDDPANYSLLNWVICGAETGPGKRPMDLRWAGALLDQCVGAGVPFFFKRGPNGRLLNGRKWEQYPETNK